MGRTGRGFAAGNNLLAIVERRVGLTLSGVVLFALALFGWILGRLIGSKPMFLLVYGALIVLGVAFALGRRKLAVEATRSALPTRVRQGQVVQAELILRARRRISTVILEEELPKQLGKNVRVPVPLLPSGDEVRHSYTFTPRLRGVYEVGPLVAEWSDPFGFTKHRAVLGEPVPLIVHPTTELIHDRVMSREWEDPPIRPPMSKPWPTGFEFYGMRDYVPGDDPRRIVWRKTAQLLDEHGNGRYLVRESEQGITDKVNVFLDTDEEYHLPGAYSDSFELAVRAVASLGVKHLRDGFSLSVDANSGRLSKQLRGRRHEIALLDTLAAVHRERVPLSKSLERLLSDPHRNAHNVVVTPHLEQATAARLRLVLQRGTSLLLVHLMSDMTDPLSLHRAGALGTNIVELPVGAPLDRVFQRIVGSGRR